MQVVTILVVTVAKCMQSNLVVLLLDSKYCVQQALVLVDRSQWHQMQIASRMVVPGWGMLSTQLVVQPGVHPKQFCQHQYSAGRSEHRVGQQPRLQRTP